jgi:xylan 1,4-beta-xylosidase
MDRRTSLKTIAGAGLAALAPFPLLGQGARASSSLDPYAAMRWGRGFEGQRRADLGNGTYLNPIFAGDHPDPSLLRDGEDYYVTFSSFDAYPGLVIWHSRDLVNWRPVTAALRTPIGSVWAVSLVKHEGRYFLYIPARQGRQLDLGDPCRPDRGAMVDPIDLHLPDHIDPGHAVGEDGERWLFLSGGDRVKLAATASPRSAGPSMSTIPGIIRRTGRSRASRPRGRRSSAAAAISTWSPRSAARRGRRPGIW